MENLKENIKEMEKIQKEIYKLKESNNKLEYIKVELYHNNYEEFTKNDNTIKNNKKKIEVNQLKIAILKNNIHFLFRNDFEGIKAKILNYYENKNIGEKTKKKIEEEIKKYFKDNYNVNICCYISITKDDYEYSMEIRFAFLSDEGYRNYTLEYNEEFKITFEKRKYNNYELKIYNYNNIVEYVEIKDLNKKAKEIFREYEKAQEKIEKLRLQQKEIYHNLTDYLHGFVYYKLKIETNLSIY